MLSWALNEANTIRFILADSSNTEVTGLGSGFTLQVCKPGETSFTAGAGTKSEIGSGWYQYVSTAAEADTEGQIAIRVTGTGCVQQNLVYEVGNAGVWGAGSRTLTQSRVSLADASTSGRISKTRGDKWTIPITGLGSLSGYITIDFTIKDDESDADTSAVLRVRKNASGLSDGALYLNKAAIASPVVSTDASIAIDDASDGDITITVKPRITKDISPNTGRYYDVQTIITTADNVNTPESGTFIVTADVTRAVI